MFNQYRAINWYSSLFVLAAVWSPIQTPEPGSKSSENISPPISAADPAAAQQSAKPQTIPDTPSTSPSKSFSFVIDQLEFDDESVQKDLKPNPPPPGGLMVVQKVDKTGRAFGQIREDAKVLGRYHGFNQELDCSTNWKREEFMFRKPFTGRYHQSVWRWEPTQAGEGAQRKSQVHLLGMVDKAHTDNDGRRYSDIIDANEQGQAVGYSRQFGENQPAEHVNSGYTAWLSFNDQTTPIGLYEQAYAFRDDRNSDQPPLYQPRPLAINDQGTVIGFNRLPDYRSVAWIFKNEETKTIGLTGESYLDQKGFADSRTAAINRVGQAIGWSVFYTGNSTYDEIHAWFYDGEKTAKIPKPDFKPEDEAWRFKGYIPILLTEQGHVLLALTARSGSPSTVLCYFDGKNSKILGVVNANLMNFKNEGPHRLRRENWLFASSGAAAAIIDEKTVWVFDGLKVHSFDRKTLPLGDVDQRSLNVDKILNNGWLIGAITNYDHAIGFSESRAWLWDGHAVRDMCLPENQVPGDGDLQSSVIAANEAGIIGGNCWRGKMQERVAWVFNGKEFKKIGLADELHTSKRNGVFYTTSLIREINSRGQVLGTTLRPPAPNPNPNFRPGSNSQPPVGTSAWLYDPDTDKNYEILAQDENGKYLNVDPTYLSERGEVLGRLGKTDIQRTDDVGFLWTIEKGMVKLDQTTIAGLSANEWETIAMPQKVLDDGSIVGLGKLKRRYAEKMKLAMGTGYFCLRPATAELLATLNSKQSAPNDAIPLPDVKLLETPEGLARYVFYCVQRNDYDAFKVACLKEQDMQAVLEKFKKIAAKDQHVGIEKFFQARFQQFQNGEVEKFQRQSFETTVDSEYWTECTLDFISAYLPRMGNGENLQQPIEYYGRLNAHGTNGEKIELRLVMEINGRWGILSEDDMSVQAAATQKYDLPKKIADGDK